MTFLIISFAGGLLTVLAPCILPLLPVIIGGSLTGEKASTKKALVITIALGVSVMAFTFLLKVGTLFINIPPEVWQYISGGIVLVLGVITLFPSLWDTLPIIAKLNSRSNMAMSAGYRKKNFWGDVIIGASLGPIFSSCSPTYFLVLASVLPANPFLGFLYLLAYTFGLCLALLLVAIVGQKVVNYLGIAANPHGWFKKVLGVIFVLLGIAIIFGYDKVVQTSILNGGFFDVTKIEQKLLQSTSDTTTPVDVTPSTPDIATTSLATTSKPTSKPAPPVINKAKLYKKSPEITDPKGYVNTDGKPITISQFKGKKVVLVDFWTYSCINCQRTLPYLADWYKKYKDQGLEIVSIHTPEFSFEKVQANVESASRRLGVTYPIVLDNDYGTWGVFGNQFWPRKYLVDIDGYIVYDHIGEGEYDITEKAIQKALEERNARLNMNVAVTKSISSPSNTVSLEENKVKSPEMYFGALRNVYLANGTSGQTGPKTFAVPAGNLPVNKLYLGGDWILTTEHAEGTENAGISVTYDAKNVYMVASSVNGCDIEIMKDGVSTGTVHIQEDRLYDIIIGNDYGAHRLDIKVKKGVLEAFTFTFG